MTNRDLKEMLKTAYNLQETNSEKNFIKKHEKRSLNTLSIINIEFRYMGIKNILAGICLCVFLFLCAKKRDLSFMWAISSFIPFATLIPLIAMGRSERFKMNELEATSRFSLRYIRMVRIAILGIFSSITLLISSIIFKSIFSVSFTDIFLNIAIPYFLSIWGGLVITRKWHSNENILAIAGVSLLNSIFPIIVREVEKVFNISTYFVLILTVFVVIATVKECFIYVKESENLSWSLC